jgi:hypothetical protein
MDRRVLCIWAAQMDDECPTRPDVIDWGILGENAALRAINTGDRVDLDRYWQTNRSVGPGLMVDDIATEEELIENAKFNGRGLGFTLAISAIAGQDMGEFHGFVQFSTDTGNELRGKIEQTGLFRFYQNVDLWEVSYAKYPPAAPHQVTSAVRQGCVYLLRKLKLRGFYPRVAIIASVGAEENPESVRVLQSAGFDPIASLRDEPRGLIKYQEDAKALDSVWLLNWNRLHSKLRAKAAHGLAMDEGRP